MAGWPGLVSLWTVNGGWGGGWAADHVFSGIYQTPSWFVSWTTGQEWVDLHFPSMPPSANIRAALAFGLYEVGRVIVTPLIEGRGALWGNPSWTLTQLELFDPASFFIQAAPAPWTWYGVNVPDVTITLGTTETYSATIQDDQWRNGSASGSYVGTFPYYGTSATIFTLTKQWLLPIGSTFFPVTMVAEVGAKYKADFETANVAITWVQFFNTVASAWQWMGWSKAASLTLWTTSAVTHTVQWNVINYTRYTHNGLDGGALQTRFYTT